MISVQIPYKNGTSKPIRYTLGQISVSINKDDKFNKTGSFNVKLKKWIFIQKDDEGDSREQVF